MRWQKCQFIQKNTRNILTNRPKIGTSFVETDNCEEYNKHIPESQYKESGGARQFPQIDAYGSPFAFINRRRCFLDHGSAEGNNLKWRISYE